MERVLGVRQVRIIGGLLSPRALPRTLSSSREPARALRGRSEFPAAAPPVVSARCNQTLKLVAVKVQLKEQQVNHLQVQELARVKAVSYAAILETGYDTLVVK